MHTLFQRRTTLATYSARPESTAAIQARAQDIPAFAVLDLWHLLSLDAPTVAVTWLLFVEHCAGRPVNTYTAAALFLAVWAVYAGDRLLDADASFGPSSPGPATLQYTVDPVPSSDLQLRHYFHYRHRKAFAALLAVLAPVLCLLLPELPPETLLLEAALALLLGGWLFRVHNRAANTNLRRHPKEFAVGLFFAAAIYLPVAVRGPHRLNLLPGALLFAAVCTLNCLFLGLWEHPPGLARAHGATCLASRHLIPLACGMLLLSGFAGLLTRSATLAHVPLACALSTALLLVLHAERRRFDPLRLRALADLVLLTPIPIVVGPPLALSLAQQWHGLLP